MPLIGREDLVGNERYTMKSITENKLHAEFIAIIEEAFAQKTAAEWARSSLRPMSRTPWLRSGRVLEDKQAWAIARMRT
jgi:crotonobetainyl-CoA:carnitine CoA-transferase CaiB-like acyl-CoA transferase